MSNNKNDEVIKSVIDWSTIDTVLLDMDGTLLDLHYDNHFWMKHLPARYAEIKGLSMDESMQVINSHIHHQEGTLNWYCLDFWSDTLKLDIPLLKREVQQKITERPYATDFLQFLKNSQKQIYLVTNCHRDGIQLKFEHTTIESYFDQVISSHDYQQPKESQKFWSHLHKALKFDKNRTLFVDDNVQVLSAARDFGIKYLLGIHQPDSQRVRQIEWEPAICHFNEVM